MRHLHTAAGLLLLALSGLAVSTSTAQERTNQPQAPIPHTGPMYVFVADGAGGEKLLTENLEQAAIGMKVPMRVRGVHWARYNLLSRDYQDFQGHVLGANRMVYEMHGVLRNSPNSPIVLMGYSTGCRVALLAAEKMPPGSIDRIILLYPAVSRNHDLKAASQATRGTIDVVTNPENNVLETVETELGAADGVPGATAGRFGFIVGDQPEVRRKVRTYRSQIHHTNIHHPVFLRRNIVPLILQPLP